MIVIIIVSWRIYCICSNQIKTKNSTFMLNITSLYHKVALYYNFP